MCNIEKQKKGLRCRVCTGCGLCPGVLRPEVKEQKIHVLADLPGEGQGELPSAHGTRLAVADIGTTTIAMLLYDTEGRVEARHVTVNPQVKYGADVISRIHAAQEPQCARDLHDLVRKELEKGLQRFRDMLSTGEKLQLIIAANTTMTYLMMGWDTSELGRAPFRATRLQAVETTLGEVPCYIMPGMSAFVGGDITSGMYACGMDSEEEITLFIDLGTNGELALGSKNKRIACATAAGPAFEGGVNRGIWGADMIHLLAALRREKLLDETGLLEEKYFESGVRAGNVLITESAVRSVQLAKAAIAAGIKTLLDRYGIKGEAVDRVVLAGGFGYYLNPADAAEIGLLPRTLAAKACAGGNTALRGALKAGRMLLKNQGDLELQQQLIELVEGTECINLAEEPGFNECYLSSMNLEEYE